MPRTRYYRKRPGHRAYIDSLWQALRPFMEPAIDEGNSLSGGGVPVGSSRAPTGVDYRQIQPPAVDGLLNAQMGGHVDKLTPTWTPRALVTGRRLVVWHSLFSS